MELDRRARRPDRVRSDVPAESPRPREDRSLVADLLALQGAAGNQAVARLITQRRSDAPGTLARVHEHPIKSRTNTPLPKPMGFTRRVAQGLGAILKLKSPPGDFERVGGVLPARSEGVAAFVQPFDPEFRNELWILSRLTSGAWNRAEGGHGGAGYIPAVAAGELWWRTSEDGVVTILGANTKTSVYQQEPGDPRSTQSELLTGAGAQRLTYFSADGKPAFKYAQRHPVELTELPVATMPEGSYRVDASQSKGDPFVITYRPTPEDILLDAAERAASTPAAATPTPAPADTEAKAPAPKRGSEELTAPEPLTTGLPPIPAAVGAPERKDELAEPGGKRGRTEDH